MEAPERMSGSTWLKMGEEEALRVRPAPFSSGADGERPPPPPIPRPAEVVAGSRDPAASAAASGAAYPRPAAPPIPQDWLRPEGSSSASAPRRSPRPPPPPVPTSASAASWLGAEASVVAAADETPDRPVARETDEKGEDDPRQLRRLFDPFLDEDVVRRGLEDGSLIRGTLRVSTTKLGTAHVKPDGAKANDRDFLVKGKPARNRACHMDIVIIRPLVGPPRREGGRGQQVLVEEEEDDDDVDDKEEGGLPHGDTDEDDEPGWMQRPLARTAAESESDDEDVVLGRALVKAPSRDVLGPQADSQGRGWHRGYAQVVAIAEPKGSKRVIVCTLHPNEKSGGERGDGMVRATDTLLKAKPTDKRMPWILIQINDVTRKVLDIPGKLDKYQLWPVQMIGWKETSTLPIGRLKGQCLGKAGDLDAEERHALIENELDAHDVDFDEELLAEVDDVVRDAQRSFDEEVGLRLDLRKKRIFTIDPATARDLDDAIHVDLDDARQEVEIGVHIADVGHFVKPDTLADKEAQFRTTSVYLLNRVLPMLPHALCNHLCSLNPNEPKLAFSAFFRLKLDTGELIEDPKPWFKKTAIKSVCRLNYDEVQEVLDGKEIEPPPVYSGYTWQQIKDDIFLLYDVCGKVRRSRFEGGALSISKVKMIFHTRESEDGIPTTYHIESHSASHWIIEELMLLANRCVAKHLAHSRLSDSSILRRHESPDPDKSSKLTEMMKENLGLDWDAFNAGAIYRSCQAIYKEYGAILGTCVEMMTMRAGMKQAEYFVYNDEADPHHFALDFDYYTHFTSPIRRYPDVMVHRVLKALIFDEDAGFQTGDKAEIQVVECNEKKKATRKCSEQLDRAVFCIYLRAMKSWFYTVGTVLGFKHTSDDNSMGEDTARNEAGMVTVYCSQLGKESRALLCAGKAELDALGLFNDGVDDTLMLPESWRFCSKGLVELEWVPPDGDATRRKRQPLKMLSCVPIVIIPTNSVPIDYALFFVSPFHPKFDAVNRKVPQRAAEGFDWIEAPEDGVEVLHDANCGLTAPRAAPSLED